MAARRAYAKGPEGAVGKFPWREELLIHWDETSAEPSCSSSTCYTPSRSLALGRSWGTLLASFRIPSLPIGARKWELAGAEVKRATSSRRTSWRPGTAARRRGVRPRPPHAAALSAPLLLRPGPRYWV